MSIKFLVLGGGGILGLGGGECRFYFYGREDFSDDSCSLRSILESEGRCAMCYGHHAWRPSNFLLRQRQGNNKSPKRGHSLLGVSEAVCVLGVPKPGCFKPGGLQFLRGSALLPSFAPFCALVRSFALFCALLQTCVRALLWTFALFCTHLRVSASDRVWNDRVWELQRTASQSLVIFHRKQESRFSCVILGRPNHDHFVSTESF